MKVFFITNMYPGANVKFKYQGVFVKEQIDALVKRHNIDHELYVIKGFNSKLNYLSSAFEILFKILTRRFDVIHIHFGLSGLFLLLWPFLNKKRFILTLHGTDIQPEGNNGLTIKITKKVLKKVGKVIVLNKSMQEVVNEYNNNTVMIPCGVDTDLFKPERFEKRKPYKVLFPGDPNRGVKNYSLFSEVLEILRREYNLDVVEKVLHNLTRNQIVSALNEGNLLLMTSLSEGSPQVIKESMACNIPIVTTNVGDVEYLLAGATKSKVVSSFDPSILAAAVYDVLTNHDDENLRNLILEKKIDNNSISDHLNELYKQIV